MLNNGVGSWLQRRRMKSGTSTAVIADTQRLSYDELGQDSDRLANGLRGRGIGQGDTVAYLGENDPAFLSTFFACGLLGAIFVPLNTRLAAPEIRYQLQDSGAKVLIHAGALNSLAVAAVSGATAVEHRIVVQDGSPAATPAGSETVECFADVLAAASPEHSDVAVGLEDGAMILYTSGTTGRPKGALLTHGNLTWNAINVITDTDLNRHDVALIISPMFHVASLDMGVLPMLLKGATVVLEHRFEPGRALGLIEELKVTSLNGVPTTFQMLCEHPSWESSDISSLDKLTCGGSAVPMRVLEAYEKRGLNFSSGYGMTETAPGATMLPSWRSRDKAGSSGVAHFFTSVRIASPEGEPLLPGEVGEIQVSGPNVISQYWNLPDASAAAFETGGWFKSGDLGSLDEQGFLFVSDRLKDMIISGGENIYPAEVEQLIAELEQVAGAAVIGVPDAKWGEVPLAIVTLHPGAELTEAQLREHLDGRLARYKIPKQVVFVGEMPRTASGKIRKTDLRLQFPN
ncbi:long-chain fatty acid--CoA ligase [Arthrobacter sp. GMC3]|uniref:acyl-CoA synthetase n=1 Tax=Arthrobacter sp. GMC3 TaxID=2058894 RepID=UPI000CE37D88|nr:long-chain fatty acid--CoA ligase [Arthrobacter sp. GMC3]